MTLFEDITKTFQFIKENTTNKTYQTCLIDALESHNVPTYLRNLINENIHKEESTFVLSERDYTVFPKLVKIYQANTQYPIDLCFYLSYSLIKDYKTNYGNGVNENALDLLYADPGFCVLEAMDHH